MIDIAERHGAPIGGPSTIAVGATKSSVVTSATKSVVSSTTIAPPSEFDKLLAGVAKDNAKQARIEALLKSALVS